MSEFAERVLKIVSEADYAPITLKAMSRRFEVGPDDYAEFRAAVKALVKEGKLDLGRDKTLRKPDHRRRDHRPVPPLVEGVRVRPAAHVDGPGRPDLHPAGGRAATPPAATRSPSRSPSGPAAPA